METRLWVRVEEVIITPLGREVEPEVYWRKARVWEGGEGGEDGRGNTLSDGIEVSVTIHFRFEPRAFPMFWNWNWRGG